jgi:hypothetical protein
MAGFLGSLGLAAGRDMLYGQQYDLNQENLQLKKQQVQMGQLAMQQQQNQMKTSQAIGDFLQSETAKEGAAATDPANTAKMYQKAAGIAMSHGDLVSANQMSELAKGKAIEARDAVVATQKQQQMAKDDLSTAAASFSDNPTPDGQRDLVQKAVAAGVNPSTIPSPGTPQFSKWANDQQMASMSGKERLDFLQKASDTAINRQEKQSEHADNVALRQESMRQTASYQQGNLDLRRAMEADRAQRAPSTKEIGGNTYQYDPSQAVQGTRDTPDPAWVKIGGPKESAQMRQANTAVMASVSEGMRSVNLIDKMSAGVTGAPFANISDHSFIGALSKTGANALTPSDIQQYNVTATGLGLEAARTLTLGAGRGANQAIINEYQDILKIHPGDTVGTAAYKTATAVDVFRNRLASMSRPSDPQQAANYDKLQADFAKYPTPDQVLDAMPKIEKAKAVGVNDKMSDVLAKAQDAPGTVGLPGASDTGAGTNVPPLPAGFTVDK